LFACINLWQIKRESTRLISENCVFVESQTDREIPALIRFKHKVDARARVMRDAFQEGGRFNSLMRKSADESSIGRLFLGSLKEGSHGPGQHVL
jgi:hypothetical protein